MFNQQGTPDSGNQGEPNQQKSGKDKLKVVEKRTSEEMRAELGELLGNPNIDFSWLINKEAGVLLVRLANKWTIPEFSRIWEAWSNVEGEDESTVVVDLTDEPALYVPPGILSFGSSPIIERLKNKTILVVGAGSFATAIVNTMQRLPGKHIKNVLFCKTMQEAKLELGIEQ